MASGRDQKKAFRVHLSNFIIQNRALEGRALQDVSKLENDGGCPVGPKC